MHRPEMFSMLRLSPVLFVIVLSTRLLAQSSSNGLNAPPDSLRSVTAYCDTIEHDSESQVPRIFARRASAAGELSGWVEFDSRAAWSRAGSPKPVALVWYREAKIARVRLAPDDAESRHVYVDYCYRDDGHLARLRPMPRVERKGEPNRYQCSYVLRLERLYPPEGPALTTFAYSDGAGFVNGLLPYLPGIIDEPWLLPEHTVFTYPPMTWPEYNNVADLPFNELLYATSR